MKAIIYLLILTYSLKAQTLPTITTGALEAYKCMAVNEGSNSQTNGTCLACFNWGISARAYNSANSNVCGEIISKNPIEGCKIYDPEYEDIASTTSPNVNSCSKCEKKFYNVWELSDGGNMISVCSDIERGCTGKIDKCEQTICYSGYSNGTMYSSQLCHICKPGYIPAEVDIWEKGAKSCVKGNMPDNCNTWRVWVFILVLFVWAVKRVLHWMVYLKHLVQIIF